MTFNEQNTVEHFIIHQLTGVNLNAVQGNVVKEDAVEYDTVKWKYIQVLFNAQMVRFILNQHQKKCVYFSLIQFKGPKKDCFYTNHLIKKNRYIFHPFYEFSWLPDSQTISNTYQQSILLF